MGGQIGALEQVEIRTLWRHEEHGFSRWLFDNPEILGKALGFPLTMLEREKWVGSFKVDLVAETSGGRRVIIENQLEPSNHDHLGKLLTYATNLDAKIAVWLVTHPRPEHVRTMAWLNEYTPADTAFYLAKLEAFRIGSSNPAPLVTVVVAPSTDSKALGEEKKDLAERHVLRLKFWEGLLNVAKQEGLNLHSNRTPTRDYWLDAGAGGGGLKWVYLIWMDDTAAADLQIDSNDTARNKRAFDYLFAHKDSIEESFGAPLQWERLDENRASRVRCLIQDGGLNSPQEKWPELQAAMVNAMLRLHHAIAPHLNSIPR